MNEWIISAIFGYNFDELSAFFQNDVILHKFLSCAIEMRSPLYIFKSYLGLRNRTTSFEKGLWPYAKFATQHTHTHNDSRLLLKWMLFKIQSWINSFTFGKKFWRIRLIQCVIIQSYMMNENFLFHSITKNHFVSYSIHWNCIGMF